MAIVVTPNDGAYASSGSRSVSVRLVPPGATLPPSLNAPSAGFVFTPTAPTAGGTVKFDGSTSTAGTGHTLKIYDWDFGDGNAAVGSGTTAQHSYSSAGTYTATLTVTDEAGQKATTSQTITVK